MATRVLIVDDDAAFGDVAAALLRILAYAVVGYAATAEDALTAVERLRPDAVVLDINLPDSDGFRVTQALRDGDAPPRVLLVSSDPTQVRPTC